MNQANLLREFKSIADLKAEANCSGRSAAHVLNCPVAEVIHQKRWYCAPIVSSANFSLQWCIQTCHTRSQSPMHHSQLNLWYIVQAKIQMIVNSTRRPSWMNLPKDWGSEKKCSSIASRIGHRPSVRASSLRSIARNRKNKLTSTNTGRRLT